MDLVSRVLESSGGRLRGLIYVVDSTSLQKQLRDVAVFLYGLLTSAVVHQAGAPVLVACNKQVGDHVSLLVKKWTYDC